MSPNGSDISIVINSDPSWASIDSADDPSNHPDVDEILRRRTNYRQGNHYRRANSTRTAEKIEAIHFGHAEKDVLPVAEQKSTNQEAIDFNSPVGMIAELKEKAETLPDRDVFHPIMTGFGTIDRAALNSWRISVSPSSPALGQQPRTLGRGISL